MVIGRRGRDVKLGSQRTDRILGRADEGAAEIDRDARDVTGMGASAHPVAGLQNQHIVSEPHQFTGRGKPSETGADYRDVGGPGQGATAIQSAKPEGS